MIPFGLSFRRVALAVIALPLFLAACGVATWAPTLYPADEGLPRDVGSDRWLKVHMFSGDVYVLELWEDPGQSENLKGAGVLFGPSREVGTELVVDIPRDSIALLETNDRDVVGEFALTGLSVFTTLNAAVTIACLADPKSCFGSCPTFYASEDDDRPLAEGFSSSFARALEERDIDRLGLIAAPGTFSLVMRNEAQETHAVRHVRLLGAPVFDGSTVLLSNEGTFVRATATEMPLTCSTANGSCLSQVEKRDDVEYAPTTDVEDLATREEMRLSFGPVSGRVGLVLSARHFFVTTYVFYQSLAYAGARTGDLLASLERGEPGLSERVLGVAEELGGIEVWVRERGGAWRVTGTFDEAGPIAADQQVVDLGVFGDAEIEVELRMAQGNWRIDEVGLALLEGAVEPWVIDVDSVTSLAGTAPDVAHRLLDPESYLVTTQGDGYQLWFTIPEGGDHRLFLDSQGYYYEWMREGWLVEQNALLAASVLSRPRDALRSMAPGFKEIEPEMEQLFWSSRFRR
jgi:hypothetical protein